ncbi:MAG: hypothetical protein WBA91_02085 [Paracoccaceae bacterium]
MARRSKIQSDETATPETDISSDVMAQEDQPSPVEEMAEGDPTEEAATTDTTAELGPEIGNRARQEVRGSFWPLLAASILSAAVGAAGVIGLLKLYPEFLGQAPQGSLEERLAAAESRLADLAGSVAAPQPQADVKIDDETLLALKTAILAEIEPVSADEGALTKEVNDLQARLAALEASPTVAAVDTEGLAAANAETKRLQEEAAALARAAKTSAAMADLRAAMASGTAFDGALATLEEAGIDLPQGLVEQSGGVATLARLQEDFPAAARAALSHSLAEAGGQGGWAGLMALLRSQTGARSLSPQEGDDPDAILSRAEAALGKADVQTALTEISTLPDSGQQQMAQWVEMAKGNLAATEGLRLLSEAVK